jgi:hypothetical protein
MADCNPIEWRPVRGYESLYEVSSTGLVRSLDRITPHGHRWRGRVLRPALRSRYLYVVFGTKESRSVHRMVAEAFISAPPSARHVVNHKNGNKLDNAAENLEWCTHAENNRHGWATGLLRAARKFSVDEANDIRTKRLSGWTFAQLADHFGVGTGTIQRVVNRTHGY